MTTTTEPNQALIEQHRDINTHFDWWDGVYDCFHADMQAIGIDVDKMYFSGFWSQGDGACFDGSVSHWEKFLPSVDPDYKDPVLIDHARSFFSFSCSHGHGHYYHHQSVRYDSDLPLPESSIDMDFAEQYSPYPVDDLRTMAWLAVLSRYDSGSLEQYFREAFADHMQTLYSNLEDEYDYFTSDEAIWASIVANDLHLEESNDE